MAYDKAIAFRVAVIMELHDEGGFNFREIADWCEMDTHKVQQAYYQYTNKTRRQAQARASKLRRAERSETHAR